MRTKSWLMALVLMVGALSFWNGVEAPPAQACSCVGGTLSEKLENADYVAEITVTGEKSRAGTEVTYDAVVHLVWKGGKDKEVTLTTDEQTTACGLGKIRSGETFVTWAHGSNGDYSTGWCGLPEEHRDEWQPKVEAITGPPTKVSDAISTQTPDEPIQPSALGPWEWLILLAISLLGLE